MFVPGRFAVSDPAALDALLERDAFVTLVSVMDGVPFASHLPVLAERDGDALVLRGHWARGNPQWRDIGTQTVLVIVHGPHAYVSPTWYEQPEQGVPTWNYTVAHLHGTVTLIEDRDALAALVAALAAKYEAGVGSDWRFPDSAPGTRHELTGIVGFELAVTRIQIKHKLSQHHSAGNLAGAIAGLERQAPGEPHEIAALMRQVLATNTTGKLPSP